MSTKSLKLQDLEMDSFTTVNKHSIKIYFIEHASLFFDINGYIIYFDALTTYGGLDELPKANLMVFTHNHYDHFEIAAIKALEKNQTEIIGNKDVINDIKNDGSIALKTHLLDYGDSFSKDFIKIQAFPAYNTTNTQFHPKDRDNAYLLDIDGMTFYIPGDCEDMPELGNYKNLDVLFLPVNQPYTMTIDQAVKTVRMMQPKIFYPIHYGDTDIPALVERLKNDGVDVRVRRMP